MPVSLRSKVDKHVVGGFPHALAVYLRRQLLGDLGVQKGGTSCQYSGRTFTLFAKLSDIVADGEGLKFAFDYVACSGLRPCIRCPKAFLKGSGLAHRRPGFVETSCRGHRRLNFAAIGDIHDEVDEALAAEAEVRAGHRSAARLASKEQASGIHAIRHGLLADMQLRE